MSIKKFPGAVISDVPVEPAGNYQDSAASGVWTLEQQAYWESQGLWPVPGNTNPDLFIENLFSTYLYTGNGSTQTITNGIDLDGEGGLVWVKGRSAAFYHILTDSARGAPSSLYTNTTAAADNTTPYIPAFNSNGFNVEYTGGSPTNTNAETYASWTFRKAPQFFDVVTFTTDGSGGAVFSHNLGSTPGCIIFKSTSASQWPVYHRGLGGSQDIYLNLTNAAGAQSGWCTLTSTEVTVIPSVFNASETYVGYLFAHDAGGFGDDGQQNVISCGSVTLDGAGQGNVNLGYEPQWVMYKRTDGAGNWIISDSMRGWTALPNQGAASFLANSTAVEGAYSPASYPNSTGFLISGSSGQSFIYIAIRRGPMATPESGTEVFAIQQDDAGGTTPAFVSGFPVDVAYSKNVAGTAINFFGSRLQGANYLRTNDTTAETANTDFKYDYNNGWNSEPTQGASTLLYMFRRAPSFMDVVAYTGTGSNAVVKHSLSVIPEVIITKRRDATRNWAYYTNLGASTYTAAILNDTYAPGATPASYDTALTAQPSSTDFYVGTSYDCNASTGTYVAYLFATCPGVSKVGSYTGTAADLNVDCGFTTGARFILIKRTDASGDWYVWDSVRGITAGNDPYLLLNSTAAEVTGTDYIDPLASGFTVTSNASSTVKVNTGTYIFLAIA